MQRRNWSFYFTCNCYLGDGGQVDSSVMIIQASGDWYMRQARPLPLGCRIESLCKGQSLTLWKSFTLLGICAKEITGHTHTNLSQVSCHSSDATGENICLRKNEVPALG
jgi:hypothetical protein